MTRLLLPAVFATGFTGLAIAGLMLDSTGSQTSLGAGPATASVTNSSVDLGGPTAAGAAEAWFARERRGARLDLARSASLSGPALEIAPVVLISPRPVPRATARPAPAAPIRATAQGKRAPKTTQRRVARRHVPQATQDTPPNRVAALETTPTKSRRTPWLLGGFR